MGVGTPTAADAARWTAARLPPGTQVRPVTSQRRALAVIHTLEVVAPDGSTSEVLAKCGAGARGPQAARPNLARRPTDTPIAEFEHAAASRLHDLMASVAGVRAPAVIASQADPPIVVLERFGAATDLTRLLRRSALAPSPEIRRRVIDAYAAAGRAAQRMAEAGPLPDRPASHPSAEDLLVTAREMAGFLDGLAGPLPTRAVRRAEELLHGTDAWPIAAGHGDFAPRNVLVLDDGIGVIDALFALNVPRFEDPARFVVNTLAPLAEIPVPTAAGRRVGREAVEVFLAECVPAEHRSRFEATCLVVALDRWCALAARRQVPLRMRLRARTGLRAMPVVVRQLLERTA